MTFDPQRPRYNLAFNGKDYELIGTMELLENIEYTLKRNIVDICTSCIELPTYEFCRVLEKVLEGKYSLSEIKTIIWQDIGAEELITLRLNVYAFLKICIAKPNKRVEVAQKLGELLKQGEAQPSLGETTEGSV